MTRSINDHAQTTSSCLLLSSSTSSTLQQEREEASPKVQEGPHPLPPAQLSLLIPTTTSQSNTTPPRLSAPNRGLTIPTHPQPRPTCKDATYPRLHHAGRQGHVQPQVGQDRPQNGHALGSDPRTRPYAFAYYDFGFAHTGSSAQ